MKVTATIKKDIIDGAVHIVPRYVYNTINSFIHSSPKPEYSFNWAFKVGKIYYFFKKNKWTLVIVEEATATETDADVVVLRDKRDREVLKLQAGRNGGLWLKIASVSKLFNFFFEEELSRHFLDTQRGEKEPIPLLLVAAKIAEYAEFKISFPSEETSS